jgi:hypothetical protein
MKSVGQSRRVTYGHYRDDDKGFVQGPSLARRSALTRGTLPGVWHVRLGNNVVVDHIYV